MPCGHTFCRSCLEDFIGRGNKTCPDCREPFAATSATALRKNIQLVRCIGDASTHAPASQSPASQSPASQAPASQFPASQSSASQSPASHAPASQAPASHAPAVQSFIGQVVSKPSSESGGECPYCHMIFPYDVIVDHVERCSSSSRSRPPSTAVDNSGAECPYCRRTFSLAEIVDHAEQCGRSSQHTSNHTPAEPEKKYVVIDGNTYLDLGNGDYADSTGQTYSLIGGVRLIPYRTKRHRTVPYF